MKPPAARRRSGSIACCVATCSWPPRLWSARARRLERRRPLRPSRRLSSLAGVSDGTGPSAASGSDEGCRGVPRVPPRVVRSSSSSPPPSPSPRVARSRSCLYVAFFVPPLGVCSPFWLMGRPGSPPRSPSAPAPCTPPTWWIEPSRPLEPSPAPSPRVPRVRPCQRWTRVESFGSLAFPPLAFVVHPSGFAPRAAAARGEFGDEVRSRRGGPRPCAGGRDGRRRRRR